jgi:hypothetical protein
MIVQLLHPQTSSSTNPKSQPMHAGDGEAAGFHVGGGRILRSSINQRDQHHSKSEPAQLCSASFCRGPSRSLRRSAARSQPNRAALVLRWLTRPGYRSQASSIHVACPLPRFAKKKRSNNILPTRSFLFSHLCRWADCETSPPVRTLGR